MEYKNFELGVLFHSKYDDSSIKREKMENSDSMQSDLRGEAMTLECWNFYCNHVILLIYIYIYWIYASIGRERKRKDEVSYRLLNMQCPIHGDSVHGCHSVDESANISSSSLSRAHSISFSQNLGGIEEYASSSMLPVMKCLFYDSDDEITSKVVVLPLPYDGVDENLCPSYKSRDISASVTSDVFTEVPYFNDPSEVSKVNISDIAIQK